VHCFVADGGVMSTIWCKHGFQQRRSNFDGKFVQFLKVETGLKWVRNFWIKFGDCRDWAYFLRKLQETGMTARLAGSIKAYRISLVFLFCNIHTQTGYYKKGISH